MRKYAWLVLSMGLFIGLVGCGDDENAGGGSAGSAGSGGTAGSAGTGGGSTATVSGIVYAGTEGEASVTLAGATVSIPGTSFVTTSGSDGSFSIETPVGTTLFLTTAPGHWGELLARTVPAEGGSGLELEVLPDALINQVAGALGVTVEDDKGIVAVAFDEESTVGGETADLGAGVNYALAFVFDSDANGGGPVEQNELIVDGGSDVIFVSVDVSADVMASAANALDQACSLEYPAAVYPSQAKVLTEVEVVCP